MLILFVIFSTIIELIILGGVIYLFLKSFNKVKPTVKVKVPVKPIRDVQPIRLNKKSETLPYDSIYTTNTLRERPIKHSDGDLIPYGLSDSDKALLEMFYDKD